MTHTLKSKGICTALWLLLYEHIAKGFTSLDVCAMMFLVCIATDSSDYEQVMELEVIILEAKTDLVSLEYDESLTLTFTPNDESFSSDLSTGEYLRFNTTINILDGNSKQYTLQNALLFNDSKLYVLYRFATRAAEL